MSLSFEPARLERPVVSSSEASQPKPELAEEPPAGLLTPREWGIALALAEAALPRSGTLPGGGPETVARLERFIDGAGTAFVSALRSGLWLAEFWTLKSHGRPLSMLPLASRERALAEWSESPSRHSRNLLRVLLSPIKAAHFDHPRLFEHVGCRYDVDVPRRLESERWMAQVQDGREVSSDLELECEVVVVGTGAGGAAAAYELACRGRAVLLLEAGDYHRRDGFNGRSAQAFKKMYLARGATFAIGNISTPVWAGRGVGGSTTINSGTCYRAPEWTLARWGERYGLTMLDRDSLDPYYERVEAMLGVAPAPRAQLGGTARVVARGADLLKLSHQPLARNAPGCDGQGVCCFGCPTGAKRSTDVSYVPEALKRGAQLITGASVERVDVVGGRARGVTARLAGGGRLKVKADAVVVAGGALLTPLLLKRSELCRGSGWLGKNLSIHPATKVMALFGERIDMSRGIPQSYAIDEYARDGLMFEGASTPLDVTAMAIPWVGRRFMDVIAQYPNLATFGFMIQDKSRGEVRRGPGGMPLITYNLSREDTARMQRGIEILCDVFLKAGARRVLPMVAGCDEFSGEEGLEALRRLKLEAGDFEITAYHPLGTCRMGTDPTRSCVGPDHEAHDTEALFVTDGSAIPSSLGVNPQVTIMAMALRAAEGIDQRLDQPRRTSAPVSTSGRGGFEFHETMSGHYRWASEPDKRRAFSFTVRACSAPGLGFLKRRAMRIEGRVQAEDLANNQPLQGELGMDVLLTGKLPYDFEFQGDDGRSYRFKGEKTMRRSSLTRSMTRLPGTVFDDAREPIASAELHFDLRGDLWDFLKSFRLSG